MYVWSLYRAFYYRLQEMRAMCFESSSKFRNRTNIWRSNIFQNVPNFRNNHASISTKGSGKFRNPFDISKDGF